MKQQVTIDFSDPPAQHHTLRLLQDLAEFGWEAVSFPDEAKVLRNRQLIELRAAAQSVRLRVSIYKVTDRGEPHRRHERRFEITKTYRNGLEKLARWADVVLGYSFDRDLYVGLDPQRLGQGGDTHNASNSVNREALQVASNSQILVCPHETPSLGLEHQALFGPERLSEYLFNYEAIHRGVYDGGGAFSARLQARRDPVWNLPPTACKDDRLVIKHRHRDVGGNLRFRPGVFEAIERNDFNGLADLSAQQFDRLLRLWREIGQKAEYHVFERERQRLRTAGRSDLADRVKWVSQIAVGRGYDVKSFEVNGAPRLIEVKATVGTGMSFFITANEWRVAEREGPKYWIYRVTNALGSPEIARMVQNPVDADARGTLTRQADSWLVTLVE